MAWIVVIILRIVVPLSILKHPLWGSILAVVADAIDGNVLSLFGINYYDKYQGFDKLLDTYFYTIQAITIPTWIHPLAKKIGYGLFAYRVIGVVLFELFQKRWLLLVFPNMFLEFFLLYHTFLLIKKVEWITMPRYAVSFLLFLAAYKISVEYMIHVIEYPFTDLAVNLASRVVYAQ